MLMATATRSDPLGASVLVLNRLYMAVHVVGVPRAFRLLCREIAEVIHLEEGRFANYDFEGWREISELRGWPSQAAPVLGRRRPTTAGLAPGSTAPPPRCDARH